MLQELEQAPDDIVQSVLDFFRRVKATRKTHHLAKFAGILSDVEAEELKRAIAAECRVDGVCDRFGASLTRLIAHHKSV